MIESALLHLPGIGPKRRERLRAAGVCTWQDLIRCPELLPLRYREPAVSECHDLIAAREERRIGYFVDRFAALDKWRILHEYTDSLTFFDIETTGLDWDAQITVIVCWHRGELRTFVEHENLDDFLEVLDDTSLLVSFNGNTFDVPRVLDAFHIPELPCPHLDLRWIAHHAGYRGGLKRITRQLGIHRPDDLAEVDGAQAVTWWWRWHLQQDAAARQMLIRYCAADVLLLRPLAARLAQRADDDGSLWEHLPAAPRGFDEQGLRAARANLFPVDFACDWRR